MGQIPGDKTLNVSKSVKFVEVTGNSAKVSKMRASGQAEDSFGYLGSLCARTPCPKYRSSSPASACAGCELTPAHHRLGVKTGLEANPFYTAMELFCALRNFRRVALISPTEISGANRRYQDDLVRLLQKIRQVGCLVEPEALFDVCRLTCGLFPARTSDLSRSVLQRYPVILNVQYSIIQSHNCL